MYLHGVTLPAKRRATKRGRHAETEPARKVRVAEKDPYQMCGKGTSVERIFRVEEQDGKSRSIHLVFLDRHGWYCEHGARCPAVTDVRKYIRNGR
jgi:hypothetical protein